jgi:hypothetical protein
LGIHVCQVAEMIQVVVAVGPPLEGVVGMMISTMMITSMKMMKTLIVGELALAGVVLLHRQVVGPAVRL